MEKIAISRQAYDGPLKPSWCKGCSFFNVRKSINDTLYALQIDPLRTVIVSGIGCSSRLPLFSGTFGIHSLHGRAIPVATGVHLANPELSVIVTGGDGDLFSIGTGHFVHAARNNVNITVLCLDNMMFAMTRNQSSPTSPVGHVGSLSPEGTQTPPLNTVEFAITCKATFVARTTSFTPDHICSTIEQALLHKGFSFVEIVAPCRAFDTSSLKKNGEFSLCDINLDENYDTGDYNIALSKASLINKQGIDLSTAHLIGIFYKKSADTSDLAHPQRAAISI